MPERQLVVSHSVALYVPTDLYLVRKVALPQYRRAVGYPSLTAAENDLLLENVNFARAVINKIPDIQWVRDTFLEESVDAYRSALSTYTSTVRRVFKPSAWGVPYHRTSVVLYEEVYSALAELTAARSITLGYAYSLSLAHALTKIKQVRDKEKTMLRTVVEVLQAVAESAAARLAALKDLVRLPPHLWVATQLVPNTTYTLNSIAVLMMSTGIIHAGMQRKERDAFVRRVVDRLVEDGYLSPIENSTTEKYFCARAFVADADLVHNKEKGGDVDGVGA